MSDDNNLDELKKLRDELQVKMHLAGMEVKEWWGEVEPKLVELEESLSKGAEKAASYTSVVIDEFAEAFRRMKSRLDADED